MAGAAVLPCTGAIAAPAVAKARDPRSAWFAQFMDAEAHWLAAGKEPQAGDLDTPACLIWQEERYRLHHFIATTPASTPRGLAAQVEYI